MTAFLGLLAILRSALALPKVWFADWPIWAKGLAHMLLIITAAACSALLLSR